jgi:hypothetical protein
MGRIHQNRDRYRRDAGVVTREERDRRRGALISGGPYRAIEIVDGDAITQPTLHDNIKLFVVGIDPCASPIKSE